MEHCLKLLDQSEDDIIASDETEKTGKKGKKNKKIKCVSADVLNQILKTDDLVYEQMYTVVKVFMRKKKGFEVVRNLVAGSGLVSHSYASKLNIGDDFDNNSRSSVYHMNNEVDSHKSSFNFSEHADDLNFAFGEMAKKSYSSIVNLNTFDAQNDQPEVSLSKTNDENSEYSYYSDEEPEDSVEEDPKTTLISKDPKVTP